MALTKWRRPHSFTLPGGWKRPIYFWSKRKMKHENRNDPTFGPKDLSGYWDGEKIVINSSEPVWVQIEVLGHELLHATHDYALWLRQNYVDPIKQEAGETLMAAKGEE
jgi:hypothetical protein